MTDKTILFAMWKERQPQADRWIGIILLVAGSFLFYQTFQFRTFEWDALGLAFWPRVLLIFIGFLSLWLVVKGNVGTTMAPPTWRAIILFSSCVAYLVSLSYLGFFVSTPVMIAAVSYWLRPPTKNAAFASLLTGLLATGALYLVFKTAMGVELPTAFWS